MTNLFRNIKNLLVFNEYEKEEKFIISEDSKFHETDEDEKEDKNSEKSLAKKSARIPKVIIKDNEESKGDKKQKSRQCKSNTLKRENVSKSLQENLEYMKKVYSIPTNGDIVLREFDIVAKDKVLSAFILFFDGMTDRTVINMAILQPLMLLSGIDIKSKDNNVSDFIKNHLLPQNQLKITSKYIEVINEINFGGCGIFIDGIDEAYAADVKGWEHRGVSRPNTEMVIRGPQEGFNEILRVNTGLIRKILKDEDLIAESVILGKRSKTPCSLMYIKDIANDSLVNEVRRRLEDIKVDYIIDSGELEQLLEDSTLLPSPQILATERPDRVASALSEGRVAVVLHGSPFVLVMPVTFVTLLQSPEDSYIRYPYATLFRCIRMFGIFLSLLLPGLYMAITNFHQEMIPTDLLFAIEASREKVPFPSIVEILIMEISFELIREAGIRIPGPIGPTLGIIGALILGQAAVAANIVSPILIIIVAVTGIGSFAIPNFSLGYAFRALKFLYIFLGGIVGFFGISLGLFLHMLFMVNSKSFGVPFMAPFAPVTSQGISDTITKSPIWKQERRPDFLNTKDEKKQPDISRTWIDSNPEEDKSDEE